MPATPHSSCGAVGMIDEDLLYTIILGKGLVFVLVVVSCAAPPTRTPAQLTRIFRVLYLSIASATNAATEFSLDTSHCT